MSHTWMSQAVSLQLKENRKKSHRINLRHDQAMKGRELLKAQSKKSPKHAPKATCCLALAAIQILKHPRICQYNQETHPCCPKRDKYNENKSIISGEN